MLQYIAFMSLEFILKILSGESFTTWLIGANDMRSVREHESNVLATPVPPGAKGSNEFNYSSKGASATTT